MSVASLGSDVLSNGKIDDKLLDVLCLLGSLASLILRNETYTCRIELRGDGHLIREILLLAGET